MRVNVAIFSEFIEPAKCRLESANFAPMKRYRSTLQRLRQKVNGPNVLINYLTAGRISWNSNLAIPRYDFTSTVVYVRDGAEAVPR